MKKEWSGDVDLNDGAVHELHQEYIESLRFLGAVGVGARRANDILMLDLKHLQEDLEIHLTHLSSSNSVKFYSIDVFKFSTTILCLLGLVEVSNEYSAKIAKGSSPTNTLYQLAWNVYEIGRQIDSGCKARVEVQCLLDSLKSVNESRANIHHRVPQVKSSLCEIVKGYYCYRHTAATHIVVIMISTETCTKKPYALPVQCLPYRSLTDSAIWEVLNNVIRQMTILEMKVVGKHVSFFFCHFS